MNTGSGPTEQRRSAELRALGLVTGELLHDLANLLSVLHARVEIVREAASNGSIASGELDLLRSDSDEIRRMVFEVLDHLRGSTRTPEIGFPILPTLEDTVNRWMLHAPSVTTTLHASVDRDAWVVGPRTFFSRAAGNLLRNAARHARSEVRLTLTSRSEGRDVELRIEDDGDGVPPELTDTLFDPFVSEEAVGTGLGLSLARWSIERLGGSLTYLGRARGLGGASFRVLLPLSPGRDGPVDRSAWNPTSRHSAGSPAPLQGVRVAHLDDDVAIRSVFTRLLRRTGAVPFPLAPQEAATASAAADALLRADPDVILLDMELGGFTGDDVLLELRREAPGLVSRTLLLSGRGEPSGELGVPMISKLTDWADLVAAIRKVADQEPTGTSPAD